MGGIWNIPDAGTNHICIYVKKYRHLPVFFYIYYIYAINGRFSIVPSVTRTFTSININTESGVFSMLQGKRSGDNK